LGITFYDAGHVVLSDASAPNTPDSDLYMKTRPYWVNVKLPSDI